MKRCPGILLLLFFVSCGKDFHPTKSDTTYYNIYGNSLADTAILNFIQPYHDSLEIQMKEVVAVSDVPMEKAKPECLLGNFIADLLLEKGKQYNAGAADFSIVNYGGLRLPVLPAGNITKGTIFELMPFDNFLVVMEIKGSVVKKLLDSIAAEGGWPVAGIRFTIRDGKASDIFIQGNPLNEERVYHAVISDYLADGGDNLLFLRTEKRKNTGVLFRDAILEYLSEQTQAGKTITSHLDSRITIYE